MKPLFHPQLINGPFGDPVLYIDFLFEKRAILFDLGDVHALAPRKILRLSHVFVSHAHMDHFIGFDWIVRICLGRDKHLHLFGPPGFIEQVEAHLRGYTWNLVQNYPNVFTVIASELAGGELHTARFCARDGFARAAQPACELGDGTVLEEDGFRVRAAVLDHKIPCLGFALEEKQHINVFKNRLDERGWATGPWLRDLKAAVARGLPDDTPFRALLGRNGAAAEVTLPLGAFKRDLLQIVPGQKLAYVVDVAYGPGNARAIAALANDADIFYIEATFLNEDAARASATYHLTTGQAGALARAAGAKRVVPFHFSPRNAEREMELYQEVEEAFRGRAPP